MNVTGTVCERRGACSQWPGEQLGLLCGKFDLCSKFCYDVAKDQFVGRPHNDEQSCLKIFQVCRGNAQLSVSCDRRALLLRTQSYILPYRPVKYSQRTRVGNQTVTTGTATCEPQYRWLPACIAHRTCYHYEEFQFLYISQIFL